MLDTPMFILYLLTLLFICCSIKRFTILIIWLSKLLPNSIIDSTNLLTKIVSSILKINLTIFLTNTLFFTPALIFSFLGLFTLDRLAYCGGKRDLTHLERLELLKRFLSSPPKNPSRLLEVVENHRCLIANSPYKYLIKDFNGELRWVKLFHAEISHPLFRISDSFFSDTGYLCQYTNNLSNKKIKNLVVEEKVSVGPYLDIYGNTKYSKNGRPNSELNLFENHQEEPVVFFNAMGRKSGLNEYPGTIWTDSSTNPPTLDEGVVKNSLVHWMDFTDYFSKNLHPFTPKLTTNLSPEFVELIEIISATKYELTLVDLDGDLLDTLLRLDIEALSETISLIPIS